MRLIVVAFLILSASACSQDLRVMSLKLDGVVFYNFSKKGSMYWLKNVFYSSGEINIRMKPGSYSLNSINRHCSGMGLDGLIIELESGSFEKQALYYSPHYRDQKRGNNPIHFGGDTYLRNDSALVIAFRVEGEGLLFEKICESYVESKILERESPIPCEYAEDDVELPFVVLIRYDSTYSLNNSQLDSLKLANYPKDSFHIMWCE